jgi:hypothetical protein
MILFSSRLLLSWMCKCFSTTSFPFLYSPFLIKKLFACLFLHALQSSFFFLLHNVNWLAHLFPNKNSFWRVSFADNSHNDDDDEKYRMKRNTTTLDLCQQLNNNVIAYIYTHLISLSFTSTILSFILFFLAITHIHTCIVS